MLCDSVKYFLTYANNTHAQIQIHGDQNITFRIFNAKVTM